MNFTREKPPIKLIKHKIEPITKAKKAEIVNPYKYGSDRIFL